MNAADARGGELVVVGRGEAASLEKDLFDRRVLNTVRYADPAAWAIATAIARTLAGRPEPWATVGQTVGLVVICEHGPVEAIAAVAAATRQGLPSALRYPAANPGSLAGVSCIAFGLRGPTLCLLVAPAAGVPVGLLLARRWVYRQGAPLVLLAACGQPAAGIHRARALLLSSNVACHGPSLVDLPTFAAWLVSVQTAEGEPQTR